MTAIIVLICAIGILLNFKVVDRMIAKEPEGAMGMAPVFLVALIPWVIVIIAVISWIVEKIVKFFEG